MFQQLTHFAGRPFAALLSLLVLCAFSGCWQEVEYIEPPPTAESDAAASEDQSPHAAPDTAALNETAAKFGDELAASLANERPSESTAALDTSPLDDSVAAATPEDDFLFDEPVAESTAEEPLAASEQSQPQTEQPEADAVVPPSDETATTFDVDPLFPESIEETPETGPPSVSTQTDPPDMVTSSSEASQPSQTTQEDAVAGKVRRAAWLMGSKLSLAALAHGRGAGGDQVQAWMEQARVLAKSLAINVPALPPRPITASTENAVPDKEVKYLFSAGQQIGGHLTARYGPEAAALFELAVKSNLLLVLYRPGGAAVDDLSTAISQAATRAGLPTQLWQPLIRLLNQQASAKEVRAAVFQMHSSVDAHLSAALSQDSLP